MGQIFLNTGITKVSDKNVKKCIFNLKPNINTFNKRKYFSLKKRYQSLIADYYNLKYKSSHANVRMSYCPVVVKALRWTLSLQFKLIRLTTNLILFTLFIYSNKNKNETITI